jgi:anthranilate 1,2-dioxygenase large subunit
VNAPDTSPALAQAERGHAPEHRAWPEEGVTRVPTWIYSDPALFEREMDVFFQGDVWNYVGLECEVPNPGDYRRSWIGTRQVVMTRAESGEVHVMENRCAHRGSPVVWKNNGNASSLTCPYHQWSYDLNGDLLGLPFLRGANGRGGMPKDFDKKAHGMRALRTTVQGGAVFATYGDATPSFDAYAGPEILSEFRRVFNGRPLRLIGYSRQAIPANWKMYFENTRDPYHATILHSFFVTFGIFRADVEHFITSTEDGRHEINRSQFNASNASKENDATKQLSNIKRDMTLNDMAVVTPIDEFGDGKLASFQIFPSLMSQQHANVLSIRHIIPKGPGSVEICWTQFGYADDDEAMQQARLKQGNLIGPGGFVSAEDGEVMGLLQRVSERCTDAVQVIEMGGRGLEPANTMVSETLIRGFYDFYRRQMGL